MKTFFICCVIVLLDAGWSHEENENKDKPVNGCDDGKTGIAIDLDGENDWKCFENSHWSVNRWYLENMRCYELESAYHVCIDKDINSLYKASIPHSGPHREVWAKYGEYRYLPPGRYVHNLEHDAVVFMYHPCAPPDMVEKLRYTATSCLIRHIITPFSNLTTEFPFAVLTYGCVFRMSYVNPSAIKAWIRGRFGKSPEPGVYGNGKYSFGLITPAVERTSYDYDDSSSPFCRDDIGQQSITTEIVQKAGAGLDQIYTKTHAGSTPEGTNAMESSEVLVGVPNGLPEPSLAPSHASQSVTVISESTKTILSSSPQIPDFQDVTNQNSLERDSTTALFEYDSTEDINTATDDEEMTSHQNTFSVHDASSATKMSSSLNVPDISSNETSASSDKHDSATARIEIDNIEDHSSAIDAGGVTSRQNTASVQDTTSAIIISILPKVTYISSNKKTASSSDKPELATKFNNEAKSPFVISRTEEMEPNSAKTPNIATKLPRVSSSKRTTTKLDELPSTSTSASTPKLLHISSTTKNATGTDEVNATSFYFMVIFAILLYGLGVAFGLMVCWCYRRNHSKYFRETKVWRDGDGMDSFNVAAVVRKRPHFSIKGSASDTYQLLEDNFSEEDGLA